MPTNPYTSDLLIASVKRRAMLPTTSETFSTTDYLAILNEELQTYVLPTLLSVSEEYAVATASVAIVADTAAYAIPVRAIGGKLRNVELLVGTEYAPLPRIEPEGVYAGATQGYYFRGNELVLTPTPTTAGTLRVTYLQRPSRLVETSAVAIISTSVSGVITATAALPSTFTTSVTYDLVRGRAPGFEPLAIDLTASAVATPAVTFTSASVPASLIATDYICLAGETAIPQIPVELHPLLAQRAALKCLEALGDPKASVAKGMCDEMANRLLTVLTPRSEGSARVIINRHSVGFGRR